MKLKSNLWFVGKKYLQFLSLVILVVGFLATLFVYTSIRDAEQQSMLRRTNTIAQFLDINQITQLSGTELDLKNSYYQILKDRFHYTVAVNSDARFVYLLGLKNNQLFFYVDSELPESKDYSPPGQDYSEAPTEFKNAFFSQQSKMSKLYTDRWGSWLTALTPIFDAQNKKVVAVLAMDISAKAYLQKLTVYTALPALVTIFLLILLGIYYVIRKKELDRLNIKAELVSLASHEIRSPLSGVNWSLDNLLKAAKTQENFSVPTATLKLIKEHCGNMQKTINDFLDIYALENLTGNLKFEKINCGNLVLEAIDNFKLFAQEKNIQIIFNKSDTFFIQADKDKLKRALNNLLSNAIKYSPANNQVTVTIAQNNEEIIFEFKDRGIGIKKEEQPKIFSSFYRTSNAKETVAEGTGLGLYFVRQVALAHKGKVYFNSELNKGSSFYLALPWEE